MSNFEKYLAAFLSGDTTGLPAPKTNVEKYLAKALGIWDGPLPAPLSMVDMYLAMLAVKGATSEGVPAYWLPELEKGAKAINTALCKAGSNKSAFLFYSDAHYNYGSQMSPDLLKYLCEHTGITKTIFGGDIVNDEGTDYDTMEYLWEWRSKLNGLPNHHSVVGNHDDGNSTNNLFSQEYVYGYLLAPEETDDIVRGDNGLYYYIDSPAEKTRYLYLDTGYEGLGALPAAQASFITESLMSTPAGWHIVVVSHIWYLPDYDQYNVRPIPITGMSASAAAVATILDNYNARSGEFANCGAKVELCIGGHVHRDYTGTTDGGIPIIVVESDSRHIRSDLTYTEGTTTEAAVNGIIADYNANKITVVRIGRGSSFDVDLSTGEATEKPDDESSTYTNVLKTVGYKEGYRVSGSSGEEVVNADTDVTGFIPVSQGDMIYLQDVIMPDADSNYYCFVARYDADKNYIAGYNMNTTNMDDSYNYAYDANGNLTQFKITHDDIAYIRICAQNIDESSIITVNEKIKGTENSGDTGGDASNGTNVLDTVGYTEGYRLNSSGGVAERSDRAVTGFIEVAQGNTLYFKNVTTQTSDYGCNIAHYDSAKTAISGKSYVIASDNSAATWWDDGSLKSFKIDEAGVAYVRFCFVAIDETSVITVNEPID